MKTSNKILLGVFVTVVIILTSIHLVIYAKYKSGDYISEKQAEEERHKTIPLPPVKYVSVTGLGNLQLSSNGNTGTNERPELTVERQPYSPLSYRIVGDTLILKGDSVAEKDAYEKGLRNYQQVQITLPVACRVKADYTELILTGAGASDSAHAPSFSVELTRNARLGIIQRFPAGSATFFNRLDLISNSSTVELDQGTTVKQLNVQARASDLIFKQATIGHIALDVDSVTTVTLQGKNLKDINVALKP